MLLRRRKVSVASQFFNLLPAMTAEEDVALPLLLDDFSAQECGPRAAESVAWVGLESAAKRTRVGVLRLESEGRPRGRGARLRAGVRVPTPGVGSKPVQDGMWHVGRMPCVPRGHATVFRSPP